MQTMADSAVHMMQTFATKRILVQTMRCGVAHRGVGSLSLVQQHVLRLCGKVTTGARRDAA